MMQFVFELIQPAQSWLFQAMILPVLHALGLMAYADDVYEGTGLFVLGLVELVLIFLLLRPLEMLWPVERWTDRRAVRVDVLYTFLYRSGALPLLFFLLMAPVLGPLEIAMRDLGYLPPNLEEMVPWLGTHPLAAFITYALTIDFAEYWRHRLQHRWSWWWALHAVHHSQRQLSLWADDRNHVLDGLLQAIWLTVLAYAVGVPGEQFVFLILLMRFVESLSHTNVRMDFGTIGNRLVVSPHYHRIHHAIGIGHEGKAGGCNFATLFPVWDVLFGTANFSAPTQPTGVRDQLTGADYGRGFVDQQLKGFNRMWRAWRGAPTTSV